MNANRHRSPLPKRYEQVDLVSTLACLMDVSIPHENKGVTFLSDLVDSFHGMDGHSVFVVRCLVDNFHQLDQHLDLSGKRVNDVTWHTKLADLRSRFALTLNDSRQLRELSVDIERLLRRAMDDETGSNSHNDAQDIWLIVSLVCMLIVSNGQPAKHSFH